MRKQTDRPPKLKKMTMGSSPYLFPISNFQEKQYGNM